MTPNKYNVRVGQIWQETDPRTARQIQVMEVKVVKARVETMDTGRSSWVRLDRFRSGNTGYRLVSSDKGSDQEVENLKRLVEKAKYEVKLSGNPFHATLEDLGRIAVPGVTTLLARLEDLERTNREKDQEISMLRRRLG